MFFEIRLGAQGQESGWGACCRSMRTWVLNPRPTQKARCGCCPYNPSVLSGGRHRRTAGRRQLAASKPRVRDRPCPTESDRTGHQWPPLASICTYTQMHIHLMYTQPNAHISHAHTHMCTSITCTHTQMHIHHMYTYADISHVHTPIYTYITCTNTQMHIHHMYTHPCAHTSHAHSRMHILHTHTSNKQTQRT